MINFEADVLFEIKDVLSVKDFAEFTNGTLFVECSEDTANEIFKKLYKKFEGKVLKSNFANSNEHIFDFVA